MFDDLRRALPDHQAHFYVNDTGPVLGLDGVVRRHQFGIATFIAPHMAVVGSATTFVHGMFAEHDQWPAEDRPRAAHAVRVIDGGGRPVVVAHFHGVRMRHGKGDSPVRRSQAEKVAGLVELLAHRGDVVVVAGDMNVLPDSETLRTLETRLGLTDLVGAAHTRTSAYLKPTRHADYLLVSDPGAVTAFQVLAEPEVSDHRPLVLDLDR